MAAFQFRFTGLAVHVLDKRGPSNEMRRQAILAVYIAAKDILAFLHD